MEKILTIVVPTYNMEDYLDTCLSSMIMDDRSLMNALEVIVVNDGSKDRSLDIATSYKERYPNTYVIIDKENGNYGSCVNSGLKEASGKYFRIVDADDWVSTDGLKEFLKKLYECDCDLVFTNYSEVSYDGILIKSISSQIVYDYIYDLNTMLYKDADSPMQMHGMTYKTSLLRDIGLHLSEGVSYTDTEYCFFPLRSVSTLTFWNIVLYQYRAVRDGQTMSQESLRKSTCSLYTVAKRLVNSIDGINADLSKARYIMLYQVLNRMLRLFYMVYLSLLKKTQSLDAELMELHSIIRTKPLLIRCVRNYKINRIRYVRIWELTGCYNSTILFVLYNKLFLYIRDIMKGHHVS